MSQSKTLHHPLRSTARAAQFLLACPLVLPIGWANAVTLSDEPLGSAGITSVTVKPNIAMVLDDSGSMKWEYMPNGGNSNTLCYGNKLYNTIAYDPTYTYKPPYSPNGVVPTGDPYKDNQPRYPIATFTLAKNTGFGTSSSTNLTNNPPFTYSYKIGNKTYSQDYYYSVYKGTGSGTTCPSSNPNNSYNAITSSADIEAPGVAKGSAAALRNYANWYSYFRTRINMMKSATGEAFSTLGDNYRVGLFYLHTANTPVKIADFDPTQRDLWYTRLYGSTVNGGTPLREALSKVGRMYAGKGPTNYGDPVQYSCQRNYTILSTDGYWNGNGSQDLNGNAIKDQDGNAPRPFLDTHKQADTLADTAYYYYATDLRTPALNNCQNTINGVTYTDLCTNNVKAGSAKDKNDQQHMTTFTLGLGVNGTIVYNSNYEGETDDKSLTQYIDIINGTANWAAITDWNCNNNCPAQVDDLWHAAVNGRGTYFSASNPAAVEAGLTKALKDADGDPGAAAAVATSNLELVSGGNNMVYLARYRTVKWDGDILALPIDSMSGAVSGTHTWSAQSALDKQVANAAPGDGRSIYFYNSATKQLASFTYTNLNADGKGALFTNACPSSGTPLTQCATLSATQKTAANNGDNLVNYLRGQSTYEADTNTTDPLYRGRDHILGDIANAMPVYVQKAPFSYEKFDLSYAGFKSDKSTRSGTVYAAANDGMLHAIDASDGTERWAYVPSAVMPNMRLLSDTDYQHRYFVDGSPTVADVCSSPSSGGGSPSVCDSKSAWHTVLIGGLDKGGCGYYALDITSPTAPKALWEFKHEKLGYSFSDPIVTRRKDGKWVAIFSSGYNNVPSNPACGNANADGRGYVFVVDAMTGALLDTIATNEGTTAQPSNLGRLNAWVDDAALNTADAIYGADMLGNVWRFDFDDNFGASGKEAFKLATLSNASGTRQPVTNKVELAVVGKHRVVFVGTGSLLNTNDLSNTEIQSIYALKDDVNASAGLGNPRSNATIKSRTLANATSGTVSIRTVSGASMDWSIDNGWYIDLSAGERINVDMQLQYNMLNVASNVPEANACNSGGYSWLYFINFETGKNFTTATDDMLGMRLTNNALTAGIKMVKTESEKTVTIVSDTRGEVEGMGTPSAGGGGGLTSTRRTMWREIQD